MPIIYVVLLAIAAVFGAILGYYLRYIHALGKQKSIEIEIKEAHLKAEEKAPKIIEKAEAKVEALEKEKKEELKTLEERAQKTE